MTRKLRRLSQPQLGAMVGVSFQQIQRYERGENSLSVPMLLSVAAALDVAPEDLLGDVETQAGSASSAPTSESAEVLEAFMKLGSEPARKHLLGLIGALLDVKQAPSDR